MVASAHSVGRAARQAATLASTSNGSPAGVAPALQPPSIGGSPAQLQPSPAGASAAAGKGPEPGTAAAAEEDDVEVLPPSAFAAAAEAPLHRPSLNGHAPSSLEPGAAGTGREWLEKQRHLAVVTAAPAEPPATPVAVVGGVPAAASAQQGRQPQLLPRDPASRLVSQAPARAQSQGQVSAGWACGIPLAGWICAGCAPAAVREGDGAEQPGQARRWEPIEPAVPSTPHAAAAAAVAAAEEEGAVPWTPLPSASFTAAPRAVVVPSEQLAIPAAAAAALERSGGLLRSLTSAARPQGLCPSVGQALPGLAVRRASDCPAQPVQLFFGVIDFLQAYTLRKRFERTFKAVVQDGAAVSVADPGAYRRRFMASMRELFVPDDTGGAAVEAGAAAVAAAAAAWDGSMRGSRTSRQL